MARKFTVYDLFLFLGEAAFQQWGGYRDGEQRMALSGQRAVDHSTLSKKAKDVPFEIFKRLLDLMIIRVILSFSPPICTGILPSELQMCIRNAGKSKSFFVGLSSILTFRNCLERRQMQCMDNCIRPY